MMNFSDSVLKINTLRVVLLPVVPPNISAIIKKLEANATWQKATPRAHREWLRWINVTPVLLQSRQLHRAGCRKKW